MLILLTFVYESIKFVGLDDDLPGKHDLLKSGTDLPCKSKPPSLLEEVVASILMHIQRGYR